MPSSGGLRSAPPPHFHVLVTLHVLFTFTVLKPRIVRLLYCTPQQ